MYRCFSLYESLSFSSKSLSLTPATSGTFGSGGVLAASFAPLGSAAFAMVLRTVTGCAAQLSMYSLNEDLSAAKLVGKPVCATAVGAPLTAASLSFIPVPTGYFNQV